MDIFTLAVSTALVGFFMFFTTFLLYMTSKSEKYLVDWSFAGIAFLSSNLIGIIGSSYELPFFLHPALANAFYIMGHAAVLSGIIKLTSGESKSFEVLGLGAFVWGLHYFDLTQSSVEARILTFYPIIIILCLGSIYVAWNQRTSPIRKALWLLIIIELIFVAQLLIRATFMLIGTEELNLFGSEFMQTSGTLFLLIFLFLLTLNFVFVVSWKKELRFKEHSRTDYLTGWLNRRALAEVASNIFQQCQRENKSFGVIIMDIDHFKKVNDIYGHAVGDEAIKHVCLLAKKENRNYDFHFRLGGEEFAILIDNIKENDVNMLSERIREAIEKSILISGENKISITVSIGMTLSQSDDTSWEKVLDRADNALYQAKNTGRNKVQVAVLTPINMEDTASAID
jgi:diguanylate cyclase (GGDEF)-like protein